MNGFSKPSEDIVKRQDRLLSMMNLQKVTPEVKERFMTALFHLRSRLFENVYSLSSTTETPFRNACFHITNHTKQALFFNDFYDALKKVIHEKLEGIILSQRKMRKGGLSSCYNKSFDSWREDLLLLEKSTDENSVFMVIINIMLEYVLFHHNLLQRGLTGNDLVLNELVQFRKSVHAMETGQEQFLNNSVLHTECQLEPSTSFLSNPLNQFIATWSHSELLMEYAESEQWKTLQRKVSAALPYKGEPYVKQCSLQNIISEQQQSVPKELLNLIATNEKDIFLQFQKKVGILSKLRSISPDNLIELENFIKPLIMHGYRFYVLPGRGLTEGIVRFGCTDLARKQKLVILELCVSPPYLRFERLPYFNINDQLSAVGFGAPFHKLAVLLMNRAIELAESASVILDLAVEEETLDTSVQSLPKAKKYMKDLESIPEVYVKRVLRLTQRIEKGDLHGMDVKKLVGYKDVYRVRVGKYRIIFEGTTVISVGTRGDTSWSEK